MTIATVSIILANGFFWNFYTGPLFNISMKIGGMLAGRNFVMYDMPDYLTKLFNVPFKVMLTATKMLLSVKGVINNINPMLILLAGITLFWMCIKAAIEMMTVLVDYLLVGCFSMVTMVFTVLGITKNIGYGAIGSIIASMVNIIVMFSLMGFTFQLVDNLDGNNSSDISKLLGMIVGVFVIFALLKQIKTIGNNLNSGRAASIESTSVTTDIIEGGYSMAIAGKALGMDKLFKDKNLITKENDKEKEGKESNKTSKDDFRERYKKLDDDKNRIKKIATGNQNSEPDFRNRLRDFLMKSSEDKNQGKKG